MTSYRQKIFRMCADNWYLTNYWTISESKRNTMGDSKPNAKQNDEPFDWVKLEQEIRSDQHGEPS